MILLDTNVVSEPIRRHPDNRVLDWLDAQAIESLYLSTISLAELLLGAEILPVGRRRAALVAALEQQIADLFGDRIIPFDIAAAEAYAKVVVRARTQRHTISIADGQIAGVAAANKLRIASRDELPFRAAGLVVINPWKHEA
ncbi:MAG: type II toxin-antitoxin system VapC family toxin [Alphaproteobacteria bacterium]|nr:type II toxin-antitoxin system VapC family toxin [Alphaproteobacteria bacterium]